MARPINEIALSAVVATGASPQYNTYGHAHYTMQVNATSVTSGATIKMQGSLDGTNWDDIATDTVSGNGTTFTFSYDATTGALNYYTYIRANVTAWTDGTYTVYLAATGFAGVG